MLLAASVCGVGDNDATGCAVISCGPLTSPGLTSNELAKWVPMPVAISADDAIH